MDGKASEHTTVELDVTPRRGPWRVEVGNAVSHRVLTLRDGQAVVLGSGRGAAVLVDDRAVSARHCRLVATAQGLAVEDLKSRNGLYVGAARVGSAMVTGSAGSFVVGCTTVTVRRGEEERREAADVPELVGGSESLQEVKRLIHHYARLRAPVMILGESGTGKDVVARALHRLGGRAGAYVPLNVAALPDSLLDGELFGHRRGAFTGAVAHRAGAFEQAHQGTLFLDEVAEMSPIAQAKLLRVVEDGQLRPVGSERSVAVDVRILSATLEDLRSRVEEERFREDLYHRLTTLILRLPPLRQRRTDIPVLAQRLLERVEGDVGPKHLSPAALARLVAFSWPGNVRQLAGVLYRAAAVSVGEVIEPSHLELPPEIQRRRSHRPDAERARELLREHGTISAAARAARIPRTTFRALLGRAPGERGQQLGGGRTR
ncbi:MAG: sigma 54-interacting transcriptional regulator [Myxococcales bacterium]|nr:sigma 54-interacting transcriptional regulator [Myxococcales bacterium]